MSNEGLWIQASSMHAAFLKKHLMYSNCAEVYIIQAVNGVGASCRQTELNCKSVKMHQLQARAVK